jgi:hypothetical protein
MWLLTARSTRLGFDSVLAAVELCRRMPDPQEEEVEGAGEDWMH